MDMNERDTIVERIKLRQKGTEDSKLVILGLFETYDIINNVNVSDMDGDSLRGAQDHFKYNIDIWKGQLQALINNLEEIEKDLEK